MSSNELRPVVFDICVPFGGRFSGEGLPKGKIAGVTLPGEKESEHRRYYSGLVAAAALLPRQVALNIIDYHERYMVGKQPSQRNCLTFAEAAQGRPHTMSSLLDGEPPVLPPDSYEEVEDEINLAPGASYGLMTARGTIKHAIVGLKQPNRHLDVFGRRGQMRIGETTETMQMESFEAERLVLLTGSYIET
jgi:hypothetical protein